MQTTSMPAAPARPDHRFLLAWLAIGLLAVVSMVFATPPFQVPDEAQHFFRAYQISEGTILPQVRDGRAGGVLPSSLPALATRFLGPVLLHGDRTVHPMPLADTLAGPARPLEPGTRSFVEFAAYYAPLAYAGEALAIGLGRQFGASTLTLFYLARLANALCALALLYGALRLLPSGRALLGFIALLPMALALYASCSPDALIIACAFLFTALVTRRMAAGGMRARDYAVAFVSALTFCSIKPVYLPLTALGLAGAWQARARGAALRHLRQHVPLMLACLAATVAWLHLVAPAMGVPKAGTSVAAQLHHVLDGPARYALAMAHTLRWNDLFYQQFVGVLGWLTVPLPLAAYLLPPLALVAAWGSAPPQLPGRSSAAMALVLWGGVIIAASVVLLMTALYLTWTPVGEIFVEGIQGRYFLPLAPLGALVLLATGGRRQYWSARAGAGVILLLMVAEVALTLATLNARYALF